MSHKKKHAHSAEPDDLNQGAQERLKFEKREAKLKRRQLKLELEMWNMEPALLA